MACRIKDEAGNTLVNFTVIDSSDVNKAYVGYDAAAKQIVITDKNSAKKWGTEEVAGSYFAEHAGVIQGLTAKKALDYAGNSLAQYVQLFLVGDKYSKLQYTAVAEKVQAAYPEEAKLSAEAAPLYTQWLQDVNSEKLNQQFIDLPISTSKVSLLIISILFTPMRLYFQQWEEILRQPTNMVF